MEESSPPTYKEALGMNQLLPRSISHQISNRINQATEEDDNCCPRFFWCWFFTFFLPLLILGIVMVIIGQSNLDSCSTSWIPTWLLISGVCIISYHFLAVIFACSNCSKADQPDNQKPCSWIRFVMSLDLLFSFAWYCVGCYWTWTAVNLALDTNRNSKLGYETSLLPDASDYTCNGPVLWFALFVTVLPFLFILVIFSLYCVAKARKANAEETPVAEV